MGCAALNTIVSIECRVSAHHLGMHAAPLASARVVARCAYSCQHDPNSAYKAQGEHAKKASAIQAELEALEINSRAEETRWEQEKQRLEATVRRARDQA
jgi:hypothetical protein